MQQNDLVTTGGGLGEKGKYHTPKGSYRRECAI